MAAATYLRHGKRILSPRSPLKKPPGEGTGPTMHADCRGNLVGRVPSRGEPHVFNRLLVTPQRHGVTGSTCDTRRKAMAVSSVQPQISDLKALKRPRVERSEHWHRSCKRGQENMRRFSKHAAHRRTRLFAPVVEYGLTELAVTVRQITTRPRINLWSNLRLNRFSLRNIKRGRHYARAHT